MKKELIGIFICMLFIGTVLTVTGNVIVNNNPYSLINGNTLYVGGDGPGNYTKIQDAIENATDGDTVFVYRGTYVLDDFIFIDVSIRLIGENKEITVISGMPIGINKTGVEIHKFTFLNHYGIFSNPLFEDFDNIVITDNIFKVSELVNGIGGVVIFSNYSTISNNTFSNCGIWLLSYHNTVYNNMVNGKPLVYFEGVSDKEINDAGQLVLINCNNITIKNLDLSNLFFSLQLVETKNSLITDNNFSNNDMVGFLFNCDNNIFSGNTFSNNMAGFILGDCEGNMISKNSFENNHFSLFFLMSSGNFIQNNNFKYYYPTFNKNILSTKSKNSWNGNYWNRGRLLPVLIWNFEIINLRRLRIIPTSPDIDWLPARRLNDIDNFYFQRSTPIKINSETRMLTIPSLLNVLEQFPITQRILDLWI